VSSGPIGTQASSTIILVDCLYRFEEFAFDAIEHSDCGLGADLHRGQEVPDADDGAQAVDGGI
jgi:hypothetical protein